MVPGRRRAGGGGGGPPRRGRQRRAAGLAAGDLQWRGRREVGCARGAAAAAAAALGACLLTWRHRACLERLQGPLVPRRRRAGRRAARGLRGRRWGSAAAGGRVACDLRRRCRQEVDHALGAAPAPEEGPGAGRHRPGGRVPPRGAARRLPRGGRRLPLHGGGPARAPLGPDPRGERQRQALPHLPAGALPGRGRRGGAVPRPRARGRGAIALGAPAGGRRAGELLPAELRGHAPREPERPRADALHVPQLRRLGDLEARLHRAAAGGAGVRRGGGGEGEGGGGGG
mmetsp:Transcript_91570/g.290463  ORF Transcript_91570/g.290463 Transcript_91570/m.290463 type:complete len:286 (-) Transcript_91570:365-1222(-)